jgi:hypothetical protein
VPPSDFKDLQPSSLPLSANVPSFCPILSRDSDILCQSGTGETSARKTERGIVAALQIFLGPNVRSVKPTLKSL